MDDPIFVPSELVTKATASLEAEVEKELEQPDPSPELAKAILQEPNENSQ